MGVVSRCHEYKVCFVLGQNSLALIGPRHLGAELNKPQQMKLLYLNGFVISITLNVMFYQMH